MATSGNDQQILHPTEPDSTLNGESITKSEYYTIAMFGKSGIGKSTTGCKLLDIYDESHSQYAIKEWQCTDKSLLKQTSDNERKAFACSKGAGSVTKQCQLLSNEQSMIRVLDIPGFADSKGNTKSTIERNGALMDSVLAIQKELAIKFQRILYFLPIRGPLERADVYLQDEMKILFYYFGESVFNCMVIILTKTRRDTSDFSKEEYEDIDEALLYTMQEVKENKTCPPVLHIPFNASATELLKLIKSKKVICDSGHHPIQMLLTKFYDEDWDEWIEHFELLADHKSLNNMGKLQMMKPVLTGHAKVALDKLLVHNEVTYEFAKCEVRKAIYAERYETRQKMSDEQWNDFANDLCTLAIGAFPDTPRERIKEIVATKVRKEVLQNGTNLAIPDESTLESIIIIATAAETIPVAYSEENENVPWDNWITHFDAVTTEKCLDDSAKLQWFKARLSGKALCIYSSHISRDCNDYAIAKASFSKEWHAHLLSSREKKNSERWDIYANELIIMAEKAYPLLQLVDRHEIVLKHIMGQVKNKSFLSRKWTCLDEAVIVITASDEVPNEYADETGKMWNEWLGEFEKKCDIYCKDRLKWLNARISNKLLPLFRTVCDDMMSDYERVVKAFGHVLQSRDEFQLRTKSTDEEWEDVCHDLSSLAEQFAPKNEIQAIVLKKLLETMTEHEIVLPTIPKSQDEALELVRVMKSLRAMTEYSGDECWEEWCGNVKDILSKGKGITEYAKIKLLKDKIEGNALETFNSMPSEDKSTTFNAAIRALGIHLYLRKFQLRYKLVNEHWEQYASDLTKIAQEAYPDMQVGKRNETVLQHFLADPMMGSEVKTISPESIEDAMNIITVYEAIRDVYNDETGQEWQAWFNKFVILCKVNNAKKLLLLKTLMSKNLLPMFESLCMDMNDNYDEVTKEFPISMFRKRFEIRVKMGDESWRELCFDLNKLAERYVPKDQIDECILNKLLLNFQSRKIALPTKPRSVKEALDIYTVNSELGQIDKFSNDFNWEKWINKFESAMNSEEVSLTQDIKLIFFQLHLDENALGLFKLLTHDEKSSYDTAKQAFREQLYIERFKQTTRGNESWEMYGKQLKVIAEMAYPSMLDTRLAKVLEHFLTDPMINSDVLEIKPQSIDEAIIICTVLDRIVTEYSDETGKGWNEWISYYDKKCGLQGNDKIAGLRYRISSKLMPKFETVCSERSNDYGQATVLFQQLLFEEHFKLREKGNSEHWDEFISDLTLIASGFSPQEKRDQLVLNKLLSVLKSQGIIFPSIPHTVHEARSLIHVHVSLHSHIKFSGNEIWDDWLNTFESALLCKDVDLSDHAKLKLFENELVGNARILFSKLPLDSMTSYDTAKHAFEMQLYAEHFESNIKLNKTWQAFADDLKALADKAYPRMDESQRKTKILDHFLSDPMMDTRMKTIRPENIEDAIKIISLLHTITEVYDDESGERWEDWWSQFDKQCDISNMQRLQLLRHFISKSLLSKFETVCREVNDDYDKARKQFPILLFKAVFHCKTKLAYEDWEDVCKDLSRLAQRCVPEDECDCLVRSKLLSMYQTSKIALPANPKSVQEALDLINVTTALQQVEIFSEKLVWEKWICIFETALKTKGAILTDCSKVILLKGHLEGRLLKLFTSLSKLALSRYYTAKSSFERVYFEELLNSKIKGSETWKQFAADLTSMAQKAYGNDVERKRMALHCFMKDPHLSEKVKKRNPVSIEVAVVWATVTDKIPYDFCDSTGEGWDMWFSLFEKNCGSQLAHSQKLQGLMIRIGENLLPEFEQVCVQNRKDYNAVTETFPKALYKRTFFSIKKLPEEKWEKVSQDLQVLSRKFASEDNFLDIALTQFLCIIKNTEIDFPPVIPKTMKHALMLLNAIEKLRTVPKYNGETLWSNWISKFEKAIDPKEVPLNQTDCIALMGHHLVDNAKRIFESLLCHESFNFRAARNLMEFQFCRRSGFESWIKFSKQLIQLGTLPYPCIVERKKKVFEHFLADPDMTNEVINEHPGTLEEALHMITLQEIVQVKFSGDNDDILNWSTWVNDLEMQFHIQFGNDVSLSPKVFCFFLEDPARKLFKEDIITNYEGYESAKLKLASELCVYEELFDSKIANACEEEDNDNFITELVDLAKASCQISRDIVMVKEMVTEGLKKLISGLKPTDLDIPTLQGAILTYKMLVMLKNAGEKGCYDDKRFDEWIKLFQETVKTVSYNYEVKYDESTNEDTELNVCSEADSQSNDTTPCPELQCFEVCISGLALLCYKQSMYFRSKKFDDAVKDVAIRMNVHQFNEILGKAYKSWNSVYNHLHDIGKKAYVLLHQSDLQVKVLCRMHRMIISRELTCTDKIPFHSWLKTKVSKLDIEKCKNDEEIQEIYFQLFHYAVFSSPWKSVCAALECYAKKAYPTSSEDLKNTLILGRIKEIAQSDKLNQQNPSTKECALEILEYWDKQKDGITLERKVCRWCNLRKTVGFSILQNAAGDFIPYKGSQCHVLMVPKYSTIQKILGGAGHVVTLGIFIGKWPGPTNSATICCNCGREPNSEGCKTVGLPTKIDRDGETKYVSANHCYD